MMKIRRPLIWACLVVTLVTVLIMSFGHGRFMARNASPASTPEPVLQSNLPRRAPINATNKSWPPTNSNQIPESGSSLLHEGLAAFNDAPIDFYGKVVDQFGNPVSGVRISGAIRIYNGVQSTVRRLTTTSDESGLFQINGARGESLSLVPQKAGFALASLNAGGIYSTMWPEAARVHPDPNHPTIIKMWKLQGSEPLLGIDQRYRFANTSAPVAFDLLKSEIVPTGGDIRIKVDRPPGTVSQRNPQDWSVRVEPIDGGLIGTSMAQARVTYAAPDSGYQHYDIVFVSTTNHWSDFAQKMYFVTSRNGQIFSKVFVSFRINANPSDTMSVTFKGIANTNSSRNWEGDPNTMQGAGK